jgi:hypothetical protein
MQTSTWSETLNERRMLFGINREEILMRTAEEFLSKSSPMTRGEVFTNHGTCRVIPTKGPLEFDNADRETLTILAVVSGWIDAVPEVQPYMREPNNLPLVISAVAAELFPYDPDFRKKIDDATIHLCNSTSHIGHAFQIISAMATISEYCEARRISSIQNEPGGGAYLMQIKKDAEAANHYLLNSLEQYGEVIIPFFKQYANVEGQSIGTTLQAERYSAASV